MLNKYNLRGLGLSTALLLATSAFAAHAATMPNTLNPVPGAATGGELATMLQNQGFTDVRVDGHYGGVHLAKAKWEGRWVDLSINAQNGGIIDLDAGDRVVAVDHESSDSMVRDELMRVGYAGIGPIERSGNVITTTGFRGGRQVALSVDTRTGALTRDGANGVAISRPRSNLSAAELQDRLRPLGYTELHDLEEQGNVYSMTALKGGQRLALTINAQNGGVTEVK